MGTISIILCIVGAYMLGLGTGVLIFMLGAIMSRAERDAQKGVAL